MNVRLTPRDQPQRTDLWGGVTAVFSSGPVLRLTITSAAGESYVYRAMNDVVEIALDDEPGDWW